MRYLSRAIRQRKDGQMALCTYMSLVFVTPCCLASQAVVLILAPLPGPEMEFVMLPGRP